MILNGTCSMAAGAKISDATQACLGCHESVTPGIVADWRSGRHSKTTIEDALKKPALERRISIDKVPQGMSGIVIGCAECHMINPAAHKDTFEHNGFKVHVVVTPADCAECHPVERDEYSKNIIEMWQAGEFPDVLSILEKAKKANKLKVYLCQPCVEVFEKKFGKLDFFDIVDKKLNGVELFTALKQEKDYTFLTV